MTTNKQKFDDDIMDVTDLKNISDVKINPDFYMHLALIGMHRSLQRENVKEAIVSYRQNVEFLESLARAFKRIPDNYIELIEEFKKNEEYEKEDEPSIKSYKLARRKMEIILSETGDAITDRSPLKM